MMKTDALLEELISVAHLAGEEVLKIYADGCVEQRKADGSPVTEADHRAQDVICTHLERMTPEVPIVAEEEGHSRPALAGDRFWLVDPLDGTKEFLSRNGEFTINIALIEGDAPVTGLVLAPALGQLFAGGTEAGALTEDDAGRRTIQARHIPPEGPTVVSSRSHDDPEALRRCLGDRTIGASLRAGSSLKFCLVATGQADLYPRLGRTMEWDTAAGDAIVRAAGGSVTDLAGAPLRYGKPGFENPHFVVQGRDPSWWTGQQRTASV